MEEDLVFLQKEKKLTNKEAVELLLKFDNDIVEAMLSLEGGSNIKKKNITLTKEQETIKELRIIVDKKDEIMDNIINKNK